MLRYAFPILTVTALSACSLPASFGGRNNASDPDITVLESPGDDVLRPRARDGQTEVPPPPTPSATGYLGETLAGLGAPAETGLWLKTGLVAQVQQGRVVTESGRSLTLELRPTGAAPSAGSQVSLMAMQTLGLHLGELATLRVYVD
ncbi:hypothetical protein [Pararhodobacter sp.]|uniref:hypothetical protein n=1 Tax=Pararhodobacter sp. TaxID=2127056 RepID=UPI002AFFB572|nr:hypothetical protein [Pararhodobacter sp.]